MSLVRESLITESVQPKEVEKSAGLVIIQNGSILLGHPKGSKWYGTYSIPKGHVETGENLLDTAIRETREEIGLSIDPNDIIFPDLKPNQSTLQRDNDKEPYYIDYKDKNNQVYKRVYFYVVNPKEPIPQNAIIPDNDEIDWAGFLTKDKAKIRVFWRQKEILEFIDDVEENEKMEDELEDDKE